MKKLVFAALMLLALSVATAYATNFGDVTIEGEAVIGNGEKTVTINSSSWGVTSSGVRTGVAEREYAVQLPSVFVDGTGPITSASAPNCTTVDNVAAIVWDNSGETAEIQFTHAATSDFAGLQVSVMATSGGATGSDQALDWSIFVEDPDTGIGTVIAQTGASFDSASMDTSPDEITLTLDATGIAAVTAGTSIIHVAIFNNGTSNSTLEIKGIKVQEL